MTVICHCLAFRSNSVPHQGALAFQSGLVVTVTGWQTGPGIRGEWPVLVAARDIVIVTVMTVLFTFLYPFPLGENTYG